MDTSIAMLSMHRNRIYATNTAQKETETNTSYA